ncbi:hypothetical protein Tco_0817921 [Tanacetum coccineum]
MKFGISSWRGSRVDGMTYLLSGEIAGSEANRIIRDYKLREFSFYLVPLSYGSVDVANVLSTTNVNLPFKDAQSPLLAYVVWIFLSFLTYPVTPPYLLSTGSEDTIFDPGIST